MLQLRLRYNKGRKLPSLETSKFQKCLFPALMIFVIMMMVLLMEVNSILILILILFAAGSLYREHWQCNTATQDFVYTQSMLRFRFTSTIPHEVIQGIDLKKSGLFYELTLQTVNGSTVMLDRSTRGFTDYQQFVVACTADSTLFSRQPADSGRTHYKK